MCGNWQLALKGSPADLRFSSTGSSHLNEDHYGRGPLHRGLENSGEVEEYCQWTGLLCRDQDGVTGLPDRATLEHHGTSIRGAMQFRAADLADFSGLGFCLVNYLPRTRSWLVPDCYNPMTW